MFDKIKFKILSKVIKTVVKKKTGLDLNVDDIYIKKVEGNRLKLRLDIDVDKDEFETYVKTLKDNSSK